MNRSLAVAASFLALVVACSRPNASPSGDAGAATAARSRSLGEVMADVARRFEIAGRAAVANRFELAEFEADELGELFEEDVAHAELPKEGPTAHIPAMADAFLKTNVPDLKKAAASKDKRAFADAFARAATACNGCHQASQKAFIQVPQAPGKSVPDLEPVGSAAAP